MTKRVRFVRFVLKGIEIVQKKGRIMLFFPFFPVSPLEKTL